MDSSCRSVLCVARLVGRHLPVLAVWGAVSGPSAPPGPGRPPRTRRPRSGVSLFVTYAEWPTSIAISRFPQARPQRCHPRRRDCLPTAGSGGYLGLRREEVAMLAGVSTDYYTRLEQGRRITPSSRVLDAIARALNLDAAGPRSPRYTLSARQRRGVGPRPTVQRVRPGAVPMLDRLDSSPAMILGSAPTSSRPIVCCAYPLADFEAMPPVTA